MFVSLNLILSQVEINVLHASDKVVPQDFKSLPLEEMYKGSDTGNRNVMEIT